MSNFKLVGEFVEGMVLAEKLHILNEHGIVVRVLEKDVVLSRRLISLLERFNVKDVKVHEDKDSWEKNLTSNYISDNNNSKPPRVKNILKEGLKEEAVESIRNLFSTVEKGITNEGNPTTAYQSVKELDSIIDQLVNAVSAETSGLVHISDLKSFDEYTYHHSLSVAVLSIAIGQAMGFNKHGLTRLTRAALLHDIGKIKVPLELIIKPSKLSSKEFAIIKRHTSLGSDYLKRNKIGNNELWEAVLFHHERVDGMGYPNGLLGNDIPIFSKIISVADVYDALTSNRPYRRPLDPPGDALEFIMSESGVSFDYEIVNAFVRKYELYPLNTVLKISDGRQGSVIANDNPLRPTIKLNDDSGLLDLSDINNLSLMIVGVYYT